MNKSEARRTAKAAVADISNKDRFAMSAAIAENLASFIKPLKIKTAFVYMSVVGEPSTTMIIMSFLAADVKVYIPKIAGDEMLLTQVTRESSFALNGYGIPEVPLCGEEKYDADINIIPLVAFDKNRNRAGHGKGYYDKYLSKATGKTVALAFSAQEVDSIDVDALDIKPNAIITEKGII